MDPGSDVGVFIDKLETRIRPCGSESHDLWRFSTVISLFRGQRGVLAIKSAWQICSKYTKPFFRCVDPYPGVYTQHIGQSPHVVAVAMRHNYEVQVGEVDVL